MIFLENKYTKRYNTIIKRAQHREDAGTYTETHHIIPKSLGGDDSPDNLVKLTPREHYICHALLPKMVSGQAVHKMYAAFNMMHIGHDGRRYTGQLYEYYKVKFYEEHSKAMTGRKRSKASRQKQSEATRGRPWSKRVREVERNKPTAKPVLVHKKDSGEFVGEWESIALCAKELSCDTTTIWRICEGKPSSKSSSGKMYTLKSHKGYIFCYKD